MSCNHKIKPADLEKLKAQNPGQRVYTMECHTCNRRAELSMLIDGLIRMAIPIVAFIVSMLVVGPLIWIAYLIYYKVMEAM